MQGEAVHCPPGAPLGSGCCRAVMVGTTLQHHVDIGGGATGLADWGGSPTGPQESTSLVFQGTHGAPASL